MEVFLNPFITFRVSSSKQIACIIGKGNQRDEFIIDDIEVIELLFSIKESTDYNFFINNVKNQLNIDFSASEKLIKTLLDENIIICNKSISNSDIMWEEYGWRDALDFHKATKDLMFDPDNNNVNIKMLEYQFNSFYNNFNKLPPPYKNIENTGTIKLNNSKSILENISFEDIINNYYQANLFNDTQIKFNIFSEFMKAAHGTIKEINSVIGKLIITTSPSGGAMHPLEAYVIINNVENIPAGLYHYNKKTNSLQTLKTGNFRDSFTTICYKKEGIRTASFCIIYTCRWARHMWKYRYSRSYRMVLFDLGHLIQTSVLVAQALGMGTFHNPAINDLKAKKFLKIQDDCEEGVLFSLGFGICL